MANRTKEKRLNEFADTELKPLMERFRQLPHTNQVGLVESLLGAYINEVESSNGGDLEAALNRAKRLTLDMLAWQESKSN